MKNVICDNCKKELTDEEELTNVNINCPYALEINEMEVSCILCDKCYQERLEDI